MASLRYAFFSSSAVQPRASQVLGTVAGAILRLLGTAAAEVVEVGGEATVLAVELRQGAAEVVDLGRRGRLRDRVVAGDAVPVGLGRGRGCGVVGHVGHG